VSAAPEALVALRDRIDRDLEPALARIAARLVAIDPSLAAAGDALVRLASNGKRLRPALLLLGHDLAGGDRHDHVIGPAIALELVHTCALLHDDVIDRTASRRGEPTVHERFAREHREADGRIGDADAFGRAVAILVGDLMLVTADDHFRSARVDAAALDRAWERFTELRVEVMAGQLLDVTAATSRAADPERALRIATLKSGRYTVARPLEIGALLAGADPTLAEALRRAGDPLGRAFQLRDDLLGVFGDPARTGKPITSDLAEGKRTLLVAEALGRLDAAGRAELEAGLGDATLDEAAAARLGALIADSGARAAVEARIETDLAEAERAIGALGVDAAARSVLIGLIGYLGRRHD
jgi:geranylgeranyl diphosphate synthase type I